MSPNTENIEARLTAYIDGELDAKARVEIERHLAENPQHRALIADLKAQRDLLRGLPVESAPADLREAIEQQLERSMLLGGADDTGATVLKIRRWPQVMAIAAILLLTVGLGVVVYQVVTPPEPHMQLTMVAPATAPVPLVTDAPDAAAASETALAKTYGANVAPRSSAPSRDLNMEGPAIALPTPGELLEARSRPTPAVADATTAPTDTEVLAAVVAPSAPSLDVRAQAAAPVERPSAGRLSPAIEKAESVDQTWVAGVLDRAGFADRAKTEPVVIVLNSADPASVDQRVRDVLSSSNLQWNGPSEDAPGQKADQMAAKAVVREQDETRFAKSNDAEDQQSILLRQNNRSQAPYPFNDSAPRAPMANGVESNAGVKQDALAVNRDDATIVREQMKSVPSREYSSTLAQSTDARRVFYVRNLSATQANELTGRLKQLNTPAALAFTHDFGTGAPAEVTKEISDESNAKQAVDHEAKNFGGGGTPATRKAEVDEDAKAVLAETSSATPTTSPAFGLAFTPTTEPTTLPTEPAVDLVIVVQETMTTPATLPTTEPAATQPVTTP